MRLTALALLILTSMTLAAELSKSRVPRPALAQLENSFDVRISKPGQVDPFDLLGNTRGVYLEGYGVVFTSEVNLIMAPPITPFHPVVGKEDVVNIHRRKVAKLDVLKKAMRELMISSAASLNTLPPGEQVVIAVTLFYYSWEQRTGLPSQILMQAPRSALLRGSGQGLGAALKVEEF